ncbi:MAG: dicarboxylate/amino acid:cation symporter [Pseudomonadota bacterium]|nr:dicarboxylate/amino acid:cation symporter [Pseudomonadota bacterium]
MIKDHSVRIILISIILGFIVGNIVETKSVFYEIIDTIGVIFLNSLKMIVVPLIMASLISSITSMKKSEKIAPLGISTIIYYFLTSLIAITVGLILVNIIKPGILNGEKTSEIFGLNSANSSLAVENISGEQTISDFFTSIIPSNILEGIVSGNMLAIIFFSIIFGVVLRNLPKAKGEFLINFWESIYLVIFNVMKIFLSFMPIGVFCLIAKSSANFDTDAYTILLKFIITVMLSLFIYGFLILPVILKIFKVDPIQHYKNVFPALLMAFSSSSSMATIPETTRCLIDNSKVPKKIVSFVVPLGATINMDGTALFECVAVIFIAQIYGVDLTYVDQFLILFIALLTSVGVAGVPAASFVAIIIILSTVGLPLEAVGLLLGIDRLLDMSRTSVNVLGDTCCTKIISKRFSA